MQFRPSQSVVCINPAGALVAGETYRVVRAVDGWVWIREPDGYFGGYSEKRFEPSWENTDGTI